MMDISNLMSSIFQTEDADLEEEKKLPIPARDTKPPTFAIHCPTWLRL